MPTREQQRRDHRRREAARVLGITEPRDDRANTNTYVMGPCRVLRAEVRGDGTVDLDVAMHGRPVAVRNLRLSIQDLTFESCIDGVTTVRIAADVVNPSEIRVVREETRRAPVYPPEARVAFSPDPETVPYREIRSYPEIRPFAHRTVTEQVSEGYARFDRQVRRAITQSEILHIATTYGAPVEAAFEYAEYARAYAEEGQRPPVGTADRMGISEGIATRIWELYPLVDPEQES